MNLTPSGWSAGVCPFAQDAEAPLPPYRAPVGSQREQTSSVRILTRPATFILYGREVLLRSRKSPFTYIGNTADPMSCSGRKVFGCRPWYPRVSGRRRSRSPPPRSYTCLVEEPHFPKKLNLDVVLQFSVSAASGVTTLNPNTPYRGLGTTVHGNLEPRPVRTCLLSSSSASADPFDFVSTCNHSQASPTVNNQGLKSRVFPNLSV